MGLKHLVESGGERSRHLGRPVLVSLTESTRPVDPLAFLASGAQLGSRVYWQRADDRVALVGLGAEHVFEPVGEERFRQLSDEWRVLLADAIVELPAGAPPAAGPVLAGGPSFSPAVSTGALSPPWR